MLIYKYVKYFSLFRSYDALYRLHPGVAKSFQKGIFAFYIGRSYEGNPGGEVVSKKKTRKVISGFWLHLHMGIHDTLLRFMHCILSCTQDNRAFAHSVLEMIVLLS